MPTAVLRRAPGSPALSPAVVRRIADAMLCELGLEQAELSVLLTNDPEIHALNLKHREKDRPTDVLAFPLDDGNKRGVRDRVGAADGVRLLGDVVVSLDTAARQARGRRRELLPEVRFLLAHGLLHLIGYDHGSPAEKRAMDAMTRRLVRSVSGMSKDSGKSVARVGSHGLGATRRKPPKGRTARKKPRAGHAK